VASLHMPARPAWICACCWESWPCHTRRAQLRAEFDGAPVSLGLLMGAHFVEAAHDLPAVTAGELYARFLGWIRGHPRPWDNRGRWR
jgi:hypothetical protein